MKALHELGKEEDWILVPTDKTNRWLLVQTEEYIKWMHQHLDKTCTMIRVDRLTKAYDDA